MTVEKYFRKSVVRGVGGALMLVYHGTDANISQFDPLFTGQGNDQYGPGFYFSTSRETALGYADGQEGQNSNVLECFLDIRRPLVVDGRKHANLGHIDVDTNTAYRLLQYHPDLFKPMDDDMENPLVDYFDEDWDSVISSKKDFAPYIRRLADNYFADTSLKLLDIFFKDYPTEFRQALKNVMGYDGIRIDFDGQQHWVAWFPEQIKLASNKDPKKGPVLAR